MEKFELIVKTLFGLESVLAQELKALGATKLELLNRAVKCEADKFIMYKANLHLRTGVKVLMPIAKFEAFNEHQLYKKVKAIPWFQYMNTASTFAIDGTTSGDRFTHSKYVALKSKDAIADLFREETGRRPNVELINPDLRINVHIADTKCTISLDSSGLPLGKRGYRTESTLAPLSENLALGLILLSEWDQKTTFIDPMCGSGTIPIEAALLCKNQAAGINRKFNFQNWRDFDGKLWRNLTVDAKKNINKDFPKIIGYDRDPMAIEISKENANRAGVEEHIHFEQRDFFDLESESTDPKHIIMNPPYGERLEEADKMIGFYSDIGSHLKHKFEGSDAWIISSNMKALKFMGLRPSRNIKIYNGPLECKFQKYELYKGSKKSKKQNQ